ncbi:uncharacterized protein F4812DRAFT_455166 [Daldinia caldariorum]|uniref:uncharacterized protein n=1 Tax=Daldinia caldariorum TaxID=326644 RepID=UPI0020086ED9|nr:uncharacterized protein F4812DRAFT_455166 [Daldinia caldariorum]KAI1471054.1 hypothetical protein F4812DRAFT_455166 [Daldinia caldariorum]
MSVPDTKTDFDLLLEKCIGQRVEIPDLFALCPWDLEISPPDEKLTKEVELWRSRWIDEPTSLKRNRIVNSCLFARAIAPKGALGELITVAKFQAWLFYWDDAYDFGDLDNNYEEIVSHQKQTIELLRQSLFHKNPGSINPADISPNHLTVQSLHEWGAVVGEKSVSSSLKNWFFKVLVDFCRATFDLQSAFDKKDILDLETYRKIRLDSSAVLPTLAMALFADQVAFPSWFFDHELVEKAAELVDIIVWVVLEHKELVNNFRIENILLVNQLWMWIVDMKTIITATTEDPEHMNNLFQNIQDNILYGETRSRLERATSVQSIMELFLGATTEFFIEKFISCPGQEPGQRINKGPIEIFRESIRKADDETRLFRDFLAGLHNEARQQGVLHSEVSRNRYHIISSETELLDIIRDIRDELHILKSLAEDQHTVWKQAFRRNDRSDHFQYYHSCTPIDVKKNVDDMLSEAEKTTNYLPLSFLTSLFALDVTSFPHESGELKYQGWWLFPILFGVTAAVSIPAIILAWSVNAISERLRMRDKETSSSTGKPTIINGNHTIVQKVTENVSGERLRRRWRNRGKKVLPQYERP